MKICTCPNWWTEEPVWDPGCDYESHAEKAFIERGWNLATVTE